MRKTAAFAIIILAFLFCQLSCGPVYETTTSQTVANENGETLTLEATPDNLNIGDCGQVIIKTILRTYQSDPIEGAKVYLTATKGSLADNVLTTEANGVAITILSGGDIQGVAVITATYSTITAMVSVDMWFDGVNSADSCGDDGGFEDSGDDDDTTEEGAE